MTLVRNQVREAVSNAFYEARNNGRTMELAADHAATSVMRIFAELIAEHHQLQRWKDEALPVISGLQAIGKELGLRLGVTITGPEALVAIRDLKSQLAAAEGAVARVREVHGQYFDTDRPAGDWDDRLGSTNPEPEDVWRYDRDFRAALAPEPTDDVAGAQRGVSGLEDGRTEWGLIVITSDGKTLLPEAEICQTREQAEERARQERSFGMTVVLASRRVTDWQPVTGGEGA